MHLEGRNAVEDGADGCFLLREEWGFPVISSEAERRTATKSNKQTPPGEKTDGKPLHRWDRQARQRHSLPVRH